MTKGKKKSQEEGQESETYFDRQFDEWMKNDCQGDIEDYGEDN